LADQSCDAVVLAIPKQAPAEGEDVRRAAA
jgi:hypothetical protein